MNHFRNTFRVFPMNIYRNVFRTSTVGALQKHSQRFNSCRMNVPAYLIIVKVRGRTAKLFVAIPAKLCEGKHSENSNIICIFYSENIPEELLEIINIEFQENSLEKTTKDALQDGSMKKFTMRPLEKFQNPCKKIPMKSLEYS